MTGPTCSLRYSEWKAEKFPCLLAYLNDHPQATGIVYCSTRKKVDEVYEKLIARTAAARYHAGMAPEERQRSQEAFLFDQVRVMVATNAFGMGIDKSNVNFVIHYNMPPGSGELLSGGGPRRQDGQDADCILLYSAGMCAPATSSSTTASPPPGPARRRWRPSFCARRTGCVR